MKLIPYAAIIFSLLPVPVQAQQPVEKNIPLYPQEYFRNPLNIPILLAGNFGECRPNHFHSGIDIKTDGKENLPVYAAADGYISRIKIEKGGFGHALYVTHPNGFTTLYAHLNRYNAALQQYLVKTQYEKESWATDIVLKPEQFPVKKGDQIAWSGNTGASTAPHLHFEIRDTETEHPLNPMLFGLPIIDKTPPLPTQVALYDLTRSIYEQTPQVIKLKKNNGKFSVDTDTINVPTSKLGIGLNVDDFMDGSTNTLNFYTALWFFDEEAQGSIVLDDIGYDETRYLHAYVDYKMKKQNGNWYQLLFELPGNRLDNIYRRMNGNRGAINITDNKPHKIRIELYDAAQNNTSISFYVLKQNAAAIDECNNWFTVENVNKFQHPNIKYALKEDALYDNVCFITDEHKDEQRFSDRYDIHKSYVPVHSYFDLFIKPNKPIPFAQRDKVVLMYNDGKSEDGKSATYDAGWYKASVRNLGQYWLAADTKAPEIKSLQKEGANLAKAKRLSFSVREDKTSVKKFRAELDGKWICFEPRADIFYYEFDNYCPKGKHRLVITVADENDNKNIFTYTFTR